MKEPPQKIMIARTDQLGDLCVSMPSLGYLKFLFPNCHLQFLCKAYLEPIARKCAHIDEIIIWNEKDTVLSQQAIKKASPDIFVSLSDTRFEWLQAARRAKIPRIVSTTGGKYKWYHYWYAHRRVQVLSPSDPVHEGALIMRRLCRSLDIAYPDEMGKSFTAHWDMTGYTRTIPWKFSKTVLLNLFSRGHGEYPIASYARLAHLLVERGWRVTVGCAPAEVDRLDGQRQLFPSNVNWNTDSLPEYIEFIEGMGAVVASSTGPLHLASLAGVLTIGLYPPQYPWNAARWGGVGERVVTLEHNDGAGCHHPCGNRNQDCICMHNLDPKRILEVLEERSHRYESNQ